MLASRSTTGLAREKKPLNEFEDSDKIFLLSFVHLFQLGEGVPRKGVRITSTYFAI
jgi:hypothetical protein